MSAADVTGGAREPQPMPWRVAVFCADWCRVCREFVPQLQRSLGGRDDVRLLCLDIESFPDEEDLLDIENFPTLLLADAQGRARYAGAVLPKVAAVEQLIDSAARGRLVPLRLDELGQSLLRCTLQHV